MLRDADHIHKISWKKVASEMQACGSYLYGNATVKKKYAEVREGEIKKGLSE